MFTGENVRAILAGRKWQTRRHADRLLSFQDASRGIKKHVVRSQPSVWTHVRPGDRLWVREDFFIPDEPYARRDVALLGYRADQEPGGMVDKHTGWREARLMPRWASRLTLIVTDIRRQRLHEIDEADATAEGVAALPLVSALSRFKELWASIHGPKAWSENRQVVAITFEAERGCILSPRANRQLIERTTPP